MAGAALVAKRVLRSCLTTTCRATGTIARAEARMHGQLVVLCYHRVLPSHRKAAYFLPDLVVTPEAFRQHCAALRKHYTVKTLHDACNTLRTGQATKKPLAAITFDDGYRDNFEFAAPILRTLDLPATFFIVAGLAGTETQPWYDRLGQAIAHADFPPPLSSPTRSPEPQASACAATQHSTHTQCHQTQHQAQAITALRDFGVLSTSASRAGTLNAKQIVERAKHLPSDRREALVQAVCGPTNNETKATQEDRIMTWAQLTTLRDQGHEIGSHSLSHEILPQLGQEMQNAEIIESKRTLEAGINAEVTSFCYPNGDHDERVIDTVRSAGYTCAVTVASGANRACEATNAPFTLKRRFIHEERLTGAPSSTTAALLRSELCGLSDALFRRR